MMIFLIWFKHILFPKISMYNIYCDNIKTLGYERKQNAYIVLLLFFLFLIETICCDPSSEPFHQDSSDEGHNICFYAGLTKNILHYPQIFPHN